jgi:hypothetical protein
MGDQGQSNAVVFNSPAVDAVLGDRAIAQAHWRDDELNIRPAQSAYDQAAWPDVRRPNLDRARRVYLSNRTTTYTYFRTEGVSVRVDRGYRFYTP